MNYIIYIILGIIQGITEPLPISSSGHIFLFKNIFGAELFNTLNFEIFSNFGSLFAILFIFIKDIIKLIKNTFNYLFIKEKKYKCKDSFSYVVKIIISTIPAGIAGVLFSNILEEKFTSLKLLAFTFIITALFLFVVRNINGYKKDNDITIKDAIIIGLFQMITILPGISRSGTVLVACLLCKIKKEDALKYTFILYFPVSFGAIILKIPDILNIQNNLLFPYLLGFLASLFITYISYTWLNNIVKNNKLWKFSIYCILLALFIFIYFR